MTGISDRILDPDYILAGVVSRSKNFSLGKLFVNFADTIFESTHTLFPSLCVDISISKTRNCPEEVRWPT